MKKGTLSIIFLVNLAILVVYGLVCMYSASYPQAIDFGLKQTYFLTNQIKFAILAIIFGIIIIIIPENILKNSDIFLISICLVLMLMTIFTKFGQTKLGGTRWLKIGPLPAFQPSELVKISIILFLAKRFENINEENKTKTYLIGWAVVLGFALLILAQKDFSTTAIYLFICLTMFLASGMKFRYVILITLFLFVGGIVGILSEPYRIKRVASFLFPNLDPSGINYQVINSKNAIISGGLFGKGFGQGYYKNGILPEVQNDFIIANIGEETGLIGLIFVFCLFGIFAFIAYKASQEVFETDKFLAYSAFGFTTTIIWQAIANIAVGLGLVPPTGIVLPFFSQGGTNLFIVIIESCLIYRVIKKSFINESPKQQEDFNYIGFDANNIFDKEE